MRPKRLTLGKFDGGFLGFGEVGAVSEIGEVSDLFFRPSVPLCQSGVGGESILAMIELGGTYDDQLFQFGADGAGLHNGAEVGDHRSQDFGPMRNRAEHIRNVATGLHEMVVDLAGGLVDFRLVETSNSHSYLFT